MFRIFTTTGRKCAKENKKAQSQALLLIYDTNLTHIVWNELAFSDWRIQSRAQKSLAIAKLFYLSISISIIISYHTEIFY